MKRNLSLGILALCLALAGCGTVEHANTEELELARNHARQVGREEAWAKARPRIEEAEGKGYGVGGGEEFYEEEWGEGAEVGGTYYSPTPEKENGEPSYEFDPEDLEQAEGASPEIQEYCEGAVSEAQELGCLSHVEEVP